MIYTGAHRAREMNYKSYREFVLQTAIRAGKPWNGESCDAFVYARVDFGRWLADCECGAACYVDPNDPFFYCHVCGNIGHGGAAMKVVFPHNREEIEAELMKRPVLENKALAPTQAAMNARLVFGLPRSWNPGESVKLLQDQLLQARVLKGLQ